MTKRDAAKKLGCTQRKVEALIRDGFIKINKDGGLNQRNVQWQFMFESYKKAREAGRL
jgi:hypothetical protein